MSNAVLPVVQTGFAHITQDAIRFRQSRLKIGELLRNWHAIEMMRHWSSLPSPRGPATTLPVGEDPHGTARPPASRCVVVVYDCFEKRFTVRFDVLEDLYALTGGMC